MLRQTIQDKIKQAMRERNQEELDSLRFVWSLIKTAEIDLKRETTQEEILTLIRKEVKNRREAILQFEEAQRGDLVSQETNKLSVLVELLPKELNQEEIEEKIQLVQMGLPEGSKSDFAQVMPRVMAQVQGQADGATVAQVVREVLNR